MSLFFLDQQGPVAKIDCLSVNIGSSSGGNPNILIPMSAVAEIIHNQEVTGDKRSPDWMFGWINWRNLEIPLIDFAALQANQSAKDFADSTRILVLNSLVEGHQHRYYAIIAKGFPHTLRIEQDSVLEPQDGAELAACISINLDCEGEHLQLPDFQQIEKHLQQVPAEV
ncbi:MAG: chemotaxis protein CheW [Porticoccaceae bacterium]|nr:chemotaxis protein CheW [Porticoccaceae bacterium]